MQKSLIIKSVFIVSVLLLFLLAIARYLDDFFIDQETLDKSFNRHLPYLIIGAILLGLLYVFFFKKAFPKVWGDQSIAGQTAIVIVFLLLSFAILRQGSITLNTLLPSLKKEKLLGIINDKKIVQTSRGTKFYQLTIEITGTKKIKAIAVSKNVYNKYNSGDTIQKEIITGYMGIKYSEE